MSGFTGDLKADKMFKREWCTLQRCDLQLQPRHVEEDQETTSHKRGSEF